MRFAPYLVSEPAPMMLPETAKCDVPPIAVSVTRLIVPAKVTSVPLSTACKAPLPPPSPFRSIGSLIVPVKPPPTLKTAPAATTVFPAVEPRALTFWT